MEYSLPFLSALFLWLIKPQILYIDYKYHISFFSAQLSSESQTYTSESLIQQMAHGSIKCYMSKRDPHHLQSTYVNNTPLQEKVNILYFTLP